MDANLEYFEKFIIKQIVDTVAYHPETDEYEINHVRISDDIIKVIEDEGVRYGLERERIAQIISTVADNIRTKPSIKIRYDSIYVASLKIGQHFKINVLHPEKGLRYVELLVTDTSCFFVLASDITGIRYGDVLCAKDSIWNNDYYIDFDISCGNNKQHIGKLILRLGKLQSVEMYSPSVVHEILDSKSTFAYNSIHTLQENSTDEKSKDVKYFFRNPWTYNPITFIWREGDAIDGESPFVITENEDAPVAKMAINNAFQLPTEDMKLISIMEIIIECSKLKNAYDGIWGLRKIRTVKAGVVKRVESDFGYKKWELIKEPQIKLLYE